MLVEFIVWRKYRNIYSACSSQGPQTATQKGCCSPCKHTEIWEQNSRKDCRAQSIPPAESIAPTSSACCSKLAKFIQEWREKEIKHKPGIPEEETSQCHRILMCTSSLFKPLGALDFQTQSKIPGTEKHPCCCIWGLLSRSGTNTLPHPRHQETSAVNNCQISSLSTEVYIPSNSQITVYFVTLAKNNFENMQRVMISDLQNIVLVTFHFVIPAMDKWFC